MVEVMKKKMICVLALTGVMAVSGCGTREATGTNDSANNVVSSENVANKNTNSEGTSSEDTSKVTNEDTSDEVQVSDINAFNKQAAFNELTKVLEEIKNDIVPAVSGSSLKTISVTVDMLNVSVGTELTEEEIKTATQEWYDALSDEDKVIFKENIELVDKKYKELLEDGKEELLASAGRSDAPYPWTENGEVIGKVEVIMEIMGLR